LTAAIAVAAQAQESIRAQISLVLVFMASSGWMRAGRVFDVSACAIGGEVMASPPRTHDRRHEKGIRTLPQHRSGFLKSNVAVRERLCGRDFPANG
jgi:hypothetical protein